MRCHRQHRYWFFPAFWERTNSWPLANRKATQEPNWRLQSKSSQKFWFTRIKSFWCSIDVTWGITDNQRSTRMLFCCYPVKLQVTDSLIESPQRYPLNDSIPDSIPGYQRWCSLNIVPAHSTSSEKRPACRGCLEFEQDREIGSELNGWIIRWSSIDTLRTSVAFQVPVWRTIQWKAFSRLTTNGQARLKARR